jgi:hypothetical protein
MRRLRLLALVAALLLALRPAVATDPYAFFDWDVSYVTAAPLGVKQQASILPPGPASAPPTPARPSRNFSFTVSSQSILCAELLTSRCKLLAAAGR